MIDDPASWDRVKRVFQAALERPAAERVVFLGEACGDDQTLRSEVESLLLAHAEAGSFAEHPAIDALGRSAAAAAAAVVDRLLQRGDRLGPYEIAEWVGGGGMGDVYKARDTRLGRLVAIKVLSSSLRTNPDLRERFEREAKTLATLSHPHICPVFDVGRQDGIEFLVMEYLEGQTLADRLAKGAVPIVEALRIATEIADALDAAHGKGIIHRDLKPANIKITPDGSVKVLDFGLAKLGADGSGGPGGSGRDALSNSPTPTIGGGTREGVIVGTAGYMSPEQARGKPLDKRTDIWAFGCVCYEILTAHPAFPGGTVSDTIAAVAAERANANREWRSGIRCFANWRVGICGGQPAEIQVGMAGRFGPHGSASRTGGQLACSLLTGWQTAGCRKNRGERS